jgi:hypothetical protein
MISNTLVDFQEKNKKYLFEIIKINGDGTPRLFFGGPRSASLPGGKLSAGGGLHAELLFLSLLVTLWCVLVL